jgi:hypothetical protein
MTEPIIRAEMLERLYLKGIKDLPGYRSQDIALYKKVKPDWVELYGDELKYWANLAVKTYNLRVQHGDILWWLDERGYRNENLLFWHEDQGIVFPYTEIDDYGSVPPCFRVGPDFLPEFWFPRDSYSAKVDHNTLVFLDEALLQKIKEDLTFVKTTKKWTCKITIQDKSYRVEVNNKDTIQEYFTYDNGCFYQEW